jgi:formylglycine-generating enzyme required for sulfatase activity
VPGDQLKPNDFGLFDMLGNALEWCHDPYYFYNPGEDNEFKEDTVSIDIRRVLRGGSFANLAGYVRSAFRNGNVPANHVNDAGFRAARTFR